jgi:hypothetical protein
MIKVERVGFYLAAVEQLVLHAVLVSENLFDNPPHQLMLSLAFAKQHQSPYEW